MKQKIALLGLMLVTLQVSFAQDRKLTIEDAIVGQYRELAPARYRNLQWIGETTAYSFQDIKKLYSQSTKDNDTITLLTIDELNTAIEAKGGSPLSYLPAIQWESKNDFHFYSGQTWYHYNLAEKSLTHSITLPDEAQNRSLNYAIKAIAYTIDNNIYISDSEGKQTQITFENNPDIICGQTVSRNEFGISHGLFWSPNANYLAYYRKDESKVTDYPLVDITTYPAKVNNIKYPMAGMASEHISLGIYNLAQKTTTFIEKEDTVSEKYLTNITWGPEEQFIYIQVLNRQQNQMDLKRYAVADGTMDRKLFSEKNDKYVEPEHPLSFVPGKPELFIYQSRRDGYNHAYLYNTLGELQKQITQGDWEITELISLKGNNMYFMATKESPLERHFYAANIKSGAITKLTQQAGVHSVNLNQNYKHFLDSYSSTKNPGTTAISTIKGQSIKTALQAKSPLTEFNMPQMEIGTLKAADGKTDLYYRLIKPTDFDENKKYPVIIYVYGGPHAQLIQNRWLGAGQMWLQYMAQKGYVVFTVDGRGSAYRGLEFENVIHRQCGVNEMKDQIEGVKFLKQLPYTDMSRVGVHGWSYGGFMTTSLLVNYPEYFKVGVAGGPVIDWKYYEVMYGERYMDTPQENPEGYQYTSLIPRAKDLDDKLLLIHGGIDPTVVWQHSQLFIQECINNQIPVDYFVYPTTEHNVRGMKRIHLMQKVSDYFDSNL